MVVLSTRGFLVMGAVACLSAGCGGREAPGRTAEGGSVGTGMGYGYGTGSGTTAEVASPLCTGPNWESPDRGVAVGFRDSDLVLVTASGERRVVYSFDVPSGQTLASGDPRLTVSSIQITVRVGWPDSSGVTRGQTVKLDAAGKLLPEGVSSGFPEVPAASRAEPNVVVAPATRRRLEGQACDRIGLFENGLVGVGFRNDQDAAFYFGPPSGTDWRQIGSRVRDVTGMSGQKIAATWVVIGNSGRDSYCPTFEPFTGPKAEGALLGDTVQILAPGARPLVFDGNSPWAVGNVVLDPTGWCVFHEDPDRLGAGRVHDLMTGTSVEMSDLWQFTWIG